MGTLIIWGAIVTLIAVLSLIGHYVLKIEWWKITLACICSTALGYLTACTTPVVNIPRTKIELDAKASLPCPKTFPRLETADDVQVLAWAEKMFLMYAHCADTKDNVLKAIEDYNKKVDAANEKIREGTSK